MKKGGTEVKVGCCGFPVARTRYLEHFSLVEIQQTFYQPPRPETAMRWRTTVPPGFEFTLKAWQLITHEPASPTYRRLKQPLPPDRLDRYGAFRPTEEVRAAWQATARIAAILGARVVVFQCPASFIPTPEHLANMRRFFSAIDRGELLFAWEPRGPWPAEVVRELCRELALLHCVDPFQDEPLSGALAYFRLHGRGGYHYRYTDEELTLLAEKVKARGVPAYVLFNNVYMYDDARRFGDITTGRATR